MNSEDLRQEWIEDRKAAAREAINSGLNIEEFADQISRKTRYVGADYFELAYFMHYYLQCK